MADRPLPPIPKIDDPILFLDVYTHKSIRETKNQDYGDTQRLSILGGKVFNFTVANVLFFERPMIPADEMTEKLRDLTSDTQIQAWVDSYKLKDRLLYTQEFAERINEADETRFFFYSYIGAVYMRSGVTPIQNWITRLINPDAEPVPLFNPPSPTRQLGGASTSRSPPPPGTVPPPLPQTTPTGAPTSLGILARLNQTASQRNLQVTYPAERCGEPHSPQWTVQCVVNGETMGSGIGKSQKIAKEVAAQEAWAALGWS
ncbi:hypothetical protein PC9H_003325 [Pleurotus ostreatus]|uniref:DRBM domain-containing protein n=2 Tax=Pleurotus TaxID=5320 RepID=A0A8H7DV70_PLEOS|nr:uncharacterized protein PC9H_003325 [Pleurotus ostreatus]KAF7436492.1 hypothetical protein PC9H_003325 [Pleurotus ostreatus]KAG9222497.1 hypothetical protein CCMSSC00406_0002832 [Pleurotus cornucopiae]